MKSNIEQLRIFKWCSTLKFILYANFSLSVFYVEELFFKNQELTILSQKLCFVQFKFLRDKFTNTKMIFLIFSKTSFAGKKNKLYYSLYTVWWFFLLNSSPIWRSVNKNLSVRWMPSEWNGWKFCRLLFSELIDFLSNIISVIWEVIFWKVDYF